MRERERERETETETERDRQRQRERERLESPPLMLLGSDVSEGSLTISLRFTILGPRIIKK